MKFRHYYAVLALGSAVFCPADDVNLLKNSGFEDGIRSWGLNEWSTGKTDGIRCDTDENAPAGGARAVRIQWQSGGDNILLSQLVAVKPEQSYQAAFSARTGVKPGESGKVQLTVEFLNRNRKRIAAAQHQAFAATDQWQRFQRQFATPSETAWLLFHLRCGRTASWFDDAQLTEIAAPAPDASGNLLKNGGFEDGTRGWNSWEWSGKKGEYSFETAHSAHDGEAAGRLAWKSGGDNLLIGQEVVVKGEKHLLLTFFAKAEIQPSTDARIQATVIFRDAANKDAGPNIHKSFTASDIYREFSWSFSTPPETAKIMVYLRNGREAVCYDDVKLIESNGVYLKESSLWVPGGEIVLDLFNGLKSGEKTRLAIELNDGGGKRIAEARHELGGGENAFFTLPVGKLQPGRYMLRVYPENTPDQAVENAIVWPDAAPGWPAPYDKLKVRNNFVTELLTASGCRVTPDRPLEFLNPREGWVYFKFIPQQSGTVTLPGPAQVKLVLEAGKPVESMQYLAAGAHRVTAAAPLAFAEAVISTMPEIMAFEYEARTGGKFEMNSWPEMEMFLDVANVIVERFDNCNQLTPPEVIDPESRERIARWRASGRKIITNMQRTGPDARWGVKLPDTEQYWSSRAGITEFDGAMIDEFGNEKEEYVPYYSSAVEKITRQYPGKTLYAATCAAWFSHRRTVEFRQLLAAGGHCYAPELYLREQRDEAAAKRYINWFYDYLRQWEKAVPGSMAHMLILTGCDDGYYALYGLDTFPNAAYKYFLDLQYQLLATDPVFFGVRGVGPWILRYATPDTLAWQAKLFRHYMIEGKRDLLSNEYGYVYEPGYLANGEFTDGLKAWTIEGKVAVKNIPNYGYARGINNTAPDGDTVAVMTRVPGQVNLVRQTIRNLKVGKRYELLIRSADYDDVMAGKNPLKVMTLKPEIRGAEVLEDESIIYVYPVVMHALPGKFPDRRNGLSANCTRLVFRATAPEAELTISDEVPGLPALQYHGREFAPADPAQKQVMFNFVQITELLDDAPSFQKLPFGGR